MFVNPISNFNFSNSKYAALRNNDGSEKPTPAEPAPQPETPKLQAQLSRDTVSFGEGKKKHNGMKILPAVALATAITGGVASCTPDYESNTSLESSTVINLKDYHKCGCDSFPVVIPGGRDTIYIEKPGEVIHDTIYVEKPGKTDTIYIDRPVYDTIYVDRPVHDTIWVKPDTVYIPKNPHFEMNDSILDDIDDFDIPTEGKGDFIYRFEGTNEYEQIAHNFLFNGFYSNEHTSSFTDYIVDFEDPKNPKLSYARVDMSGVPSEGARFIEVYEPRKNIYQLPDDKTVGRSGWVKVNEFKAKKGMSKEECLEMAVETINGAKVSRYHNNTKRGPGNMYKDWQNDAGEKPRTTIEKIKAYRKDLDDLY